MKKAPNNQGVSLAADANYSKTLAESLFEMRRNIDWLMGVYEVPLEIMTNDQLQARKAFNIKALREFERRQGGAA